MHSSGPLRGHGPERLPTHRTTAVEGDHPGSPDSRTLMPQGANAGCGGRLTLVWSRSRFRSGSCGENGHKPVSVCTHGFGLVQTSGLLCKHANEAPPTKPAILPRFLIISMCRVKAVFQALFSGFACAAQEASDTCWAPCAAHNKAMASAPGSAGANGSAGSRPRNSAQGPSTKARSRARGCGRVRKAVSLWRLPCESKSRSSVRGALTCGRALPCSASMPIGCATARRRPKPCPGRPLR